MFTRTHTNYVKLTEKLEFGTCDIKFDIHF